MNSSFNEIYQNNLKRVYNLALNYVQQPTDAEEITQDVFVKVFRELNSFKHQSSINTWIYRITINQSLDFLRHKNRGKRKGFLLPLFNTKNEDAPLDIPDLTHPGIVGEKKENAKIFYAAVGRLNENQKTAFILCFIEEMPQKEAAALMDISIKALESLLQRAKSQLRKILENEFNYRRF